MRPVFLCVLCLSRVAGSDLIDITHPGQAGMVMAIHLIDEHWDLVERIRATTGDGRARLDLNRQLIQEWS